LSCLSGIFYGINAGGEEDIEKSKPKSSSRRKREKE
jgi:hypothetical protein